MERILAQLPDLEPGWVWLTGAGPGEAGLLTLLAVKGLAQADVVVYDALVDQSILDLARPDAKLEYAGKRGGKPSARQPDISLRLVQLAREGKRVLRLKGGDPFVFGRGGEEAMSLVEAGIPFVSFPASAPASAAWLMRAFRSPIATATRRSPSSPAMTRPARFRIRSTGPLWPRARRSS
jgi:uroporphyrin-III C-methyltransferase